MCDLVDVNLTIKAIDDVLADFREIVDKPVSARIVADKTFKHYPTMSAAMKLAKHFLELEIELIKEKTDE